MNECEPVTGQVAQVRAASSWNPLRFRTAVPFRLDSTFSRSGESHGGNVAGVSASFMPPKQAVWNAPGPPGSGSACAGSERRAARIRLINMSPLLSAHDVSNLDPADPKHLSNRLFNTTLKTSVVWNSPRKVQRHIRPPVIFMGLEAVFLKVSIALLTESL